MAENRGCLSYIEDFSPLWQTGFEQDEDLSLLWKTDGLTYIKTCHHYGRRGFYMETCPYEIEGLNMRLVSIMADEGFEQDEDLPPLWAERGLLMKTFLHYGRHSVWVIWRLFSIMADRGFEQDEDLSLLWKTEGLTYMKTCLHYRRQRVWRLVSIMQTECFAVHEDFSPLWQTEGLSKMKTCLHYSRKRVSLIWLFSIMAGNVWVICFLHHGWQRVWARWRFISIMENRRFDLYKDFSPLWQTEGWVEDLPPLWERVSFICFLHYGSRQDFSPSWLTERLQDEDLSLLWKTDLI